MKIKDTVRVINLATSVILLLALTLLFIRYNSIEQASFTKYINIISYFTLTYFTSFLLFSILVKNIELQIQTSRLFIGIVFVFSGFVKIVDPIGFGYKLSDYFLEVFKAPYLMDAGLILSLILCVAELMVGLALLLNIKVRLALVGALLFMILFLPLTLYIALTNSVKDCGCFGDALKVTNWETFWKNVIITFFILVLLVRRKKISSLFTAKVEWITILMLIAFACSFEYYNYAHLPILDFRPYKVGSNLPEKMKEVRPPKFVTWFLMKNLKTGAEKKVDTDEYMKIWQDTLTWKLVKTLDNEMIDPGIPAPIHDFRVLNLNNEEITDILLTHEKTLVVVAYNLKKSSIEGLKQAAKLAKIVKLDSIKTYCLTSSISTDIQKLVKEINPDFEFCNADETTLKTIIRSNPGLVYLKKGVVKGLWHFNDFPQPFDLKMIISK